jgi:protein involved in polysaccharide export with SLBB domain
MKKTINRFAVLLFAVLGAALFSPVLWAQAGARSSASSSPSAAAASASASGTSGAATPSAGQTPQTPLPRFIPDPQLALSTPDYQVTAGDVYTLAYAALGQSVEYIIPIDTTYRLRVANMGIIDGAGKTFNQLKTQVEAVVTNNYPMSGVQFVLSRPAVFKVHVRGEVLAAQETTAWALSRLSSLAEENLTAQASLRDVTIRSAGGQTRTYDLFKARRLGDLKEDPYLRPGDVVTFNRADRVVTLQGAVERTGAYQLLEGEHLKELIEWYGSGFTPVADRTRLELLRQVNSASVSGDKIFLDEEHLAGNYALENYDAVTVPAITALNPVMFVEGAVKSAGTSVADLEGIALTEASRLVVPFTKGENYAALVRRNKEWFAAVSDTLNAYIIRDGEHIPINLNPMLYDADFRSEVLVVENDTLIIPFRQYFVTVSGAVQVPGRYPYIPDREWDYYIALAGGFVPGRNSFDAVTIADINGRRLKKSDVITPETIITARTNNGLYYFNQYAPVITTTLTIVTTFLSLQAFLNSR